MKYRLLMMAAALSGNQAWSSNMEELVVSASPLEKTQSDNPRPVSILSGNALRRQAATTLGETLQGQVGVSTASFGPGVGNPVIRGQSANRVKVMQDNLDTLDAANASADHANSVEPLLADSIETLRGPQTLRFGNGAIGGVVNIIDSRIPRELSEKTKGAIEVRHSSANDQSSSVFQLDGSSGQFAWHIDGLYRDSNDVDIPGTADVHGEEETTKGFIANTDSQSSGGSAGGSWVTDRGFIGFSVNYLENEYGIPPGGHEHEEEHHDEHEEDHEGEHEGESERVRINMRQTRYDIKAAIDEPLAGFDTAKLRLGYVDYEHTELENGETGTVFDSDAVEGRLELIHKPVAGWQGAIGTQFLDRDFGAIGDEAFIPQSTIRSAGLFIVEEQQFGNWFVELGGRVEQQSIDPENDRKVDHDTFSLSAAAQYRLDEQQRINLSLSHAQRAPSIEELFSDGAHLATQSVDQGNSELNEETSLNWELGYRYENEENVTLEVSIFYNDIRDFIYKRNTGVEDHDEELIIFQYEQEDAVFKGLEAELTIPVNDHFSLRLFGDTVRAELDQGGDVPRITPSRIGAALSYSGEQWDSKLLLTEVSKQDHPGRLEEETGGYTRLDAHFNYQWQNVMIFLRANNLLDEEIRHASSFIRDIAPEAGRNFTIGTRYTF